MGNHVHEPREHEWVTLRTFDDQIAAEMMLNFLRDHDITVTVLGNSVATTMLNRFNTVLDIRLAVPRDELEQAREALRGFEPEGELEQQPFRGPMPYRTKGKRPKEDPTEDEEPVRRRYRRAAFALAWLLPFGGGHFYAQHSAAGVVFATAIVGNTLLLMTTGDSKIGSLVFLFVAADAITAPFAVARYNANQVPGASAQIGRAVFTLAAAWVLALICVFCT
ncbi:DUF2007 domain-containing protein [Pendulispora rubella]|uniref:DUF2007 domain-containing protein n=1 Tax=Pendulispora rubella TaxID=2741070 RepID=A0ABZ2L9H0_9BACT